MSLRQRPIPADVREDIKIGKKVPMDSIVWAVGALILGILFVLLLEVVKKSILLTTILVFGPPVAIILVASYDLFTIAIRRADFKLKAATVKRLDDLCNIMEYGAINKTKGNKHIIYLQKKVDPWEVCPDANKDKRADEFTEEIFSAISEGAYVSVYGVSAPESTYQLEERYKEVNSFPEGIGKLEAMRIDKHYAISLNASSTRYIIRTQSWDSKTAEEAAEKFENAVILGEDTVKELIQTHLTPRAKTKRGKQDVASISNLKIKSDKLELNGMQVKTFMVSDFPRTAIAGLLYSITHGDHAQAGVVINFSLHFRPSDLKFDWKMTLKLRRLQRSIDLYNANADIANPARKEEIEALNWIVRLRDTSDKRADVWATVTLSSDNPEKFKKSVEAFKNMMENRQYNLNELDEEQHVALDAAWMGGGTTLFERYKGRVMDMTGVSALYPYIDGSISDFKGCYLAHRVKDATIVYKNFTKDSEGQNMIVTGYKGGGKSTLIKGLIVSMLQAGMRGYVYDVDGEYREQCEALGGTWVDYTAGYGRYADPTIIDKPLMSEINPYNTDPRKLRLVKEADAARYNEAIENTFATFALLCGDNYNKDRENALDDALMEMWERAGILRHKPETWEIRDPQKIGIHVLFRTIKARAAKHKDAALLYKDIKIYFEGSKSYLFQNSDSGDWIRDSKLIVYYIGSAADNIGDPRMNAVKIVSANCMSWRQIKRDRIKQEVFSFEVKDELQRSIRNPAEIPSLIRSSTTSRKFNTQLIVGFNDPSILFKFDGGEAIWTNSKYKIFFPLPENSIRTLAKNSHMPEEVIEQWFQLKPYYFVYSEMIGSNSIYDILKMELSEYETDVLYKTRGI